jgi:glutamine amidotransferase
LIGIIDYGMGNIFSLTGALDRLDAEGIFTDDQKILEKCDALIVPGVGAFADAMANLKDQKMDTFIKKWASEEKPLLGICLGMQLLFSKSYEHGENPGLDLIPGEVKEIPPIVKVPHMGWNKIKNKNKHPYLPNLEEGYVYFVHSYYADTESRYIIASTDYALEIPAITGRGSVIGMQFHPEKSSETGKKILEELLRSWRVI